MSDAPIYVVLSCTRERVDERSIAKFENIEEDALGRDVVTFVCPTCHAQHRSLRIGG